MLKVGISSAGRLIPVLYPANTVLIFSNARSTIAVEQQEVSTVRSYEEIPGPKPLPIIGNSWRFLPYIGTYGSMDPNAMAKKLHGTYGNIVKITGLHNRNDMVYVVDPQDFETVFRREGPWPVRMGLPSMKEYRTVLRKDFYKGIEGVATSQGKEWQDFRTKFNQTMMQPRNAKAYVGPIDNVSQDLINKMRGLLDENSELPPDFIDYIFRWALESISLVALDTRLGCLDPEFSPKSDAEAMIKATHTIFHDLFELDLRPSFRHFSKRKEWKSMVKSLDIVNEVAMKYINKAMENIKQKNTTEDSDLSILETLLLKYEDPMIGVVMALDMMMAGIDTTAHSSATLLHYLARNQDKQEKLFEELMRILPDKEQTITAQNLEDMKYLKACMKESMRISPTVFGNFRTSVQDIVLSNYRVPKGVDVQVNHMLATNKEENFPQADRFIPERWLKGSEEHQKSHPFVFLPFGFGPRMCLGRRFAELELEVVVAKIIRNFRIEYDRELKINGSALNMVVTPLTFKLEDRR